MLFVHAQQSWMVLKLLLLVHTVCYIYSYIMVLYYKAMVCYEATVCI